MEDFEEIKNLFEEMCEMIKKIHEVVLLGISISDNGDFYSGLKRIAELNQSYKEGLSTYNKPFVVIDNTGK